MAAAEFEIERLRKRTPAELIEIVREVLAHESGKPYWAENELIEVMRIIGPPDGNEDDITRMMKIHAVRLMVEVNAEKYEELLKKVSLA